MMAGDVAIRTEGLTRRFGELTAVDGIGLTVPRGAVVGLLGHNGAGKTTTARLLNGVLTPDAGRATVLGLSPSEDGPRLRARTGVLTESPGLDHRLTGAENLRHAAALFAVPAAAAAPRVAELLERFGLAERGGDRVGGYSKGMRQRLALARCLVHEPELLFLDEPTSGLDPALTREVHELVEHLVRREGRTVLLCTHNLHEAQRLCDSVVLMQRGAIVASGPPTELLRRVAGSVPLELEVAPESVAAALAVVGRAGAGAEARTAGAAADGRVVVRGLGREDVPALLEALVSAGVRLYGAARREPSLEDAYFALLEGS